MKKLAVVVAVLLIFSITVSAENGAHKIKPVLYVGGGLGMPLSPSLFSDYWKMGIGFGGGIGAQITPYIELIGKVAYSQFGFDGDKLLSESGITGYTIDGLDFKFLAFGGDMKYLFDMGPESQFAPFLLVGVGATNIKVSDVTVTGEGETVTVPFGEFSETKISLDIGGGFDYMFSPKAGLWVEGRYAMIMTEGDSFGYFPIRAGVKVLFGE